MRGNPNGRAMRALAAALARAGVTDVCVSPGSRSTAAALALAAELRPWVVTDERAAGFFALGMARETRRPVALLCTSGTAAANYLPAVVEASRAEVPLVVLTADRPPELRDCAAPQTIDQVRLFGSHVRWSVDAPAPGAGEALESWFAVLGQRLVAAACERPRGPVHANLPMREPLLDVAAEEARLASADAAYAGEGAGDLTVHAASGLPSAAAITHLRALLRPGARGVVACGPSAADTDADVAAITAAAARLDWPILADPLSGLRFGAHDRARVIDAYDLVLGDEASARRLRPAVVLQLGAPLVSARATRWLAASACPTVVVAPPGTWPDPAGAATVMVRADAGRVCAALAAAPADAAPARRPSPPRPSAWMQAWRTHAAAARAASDRVLARAPVPSEGAALACLLARLPDGAALHVGNSLPVRALDTFVAGDARRLAVACNRGANGIDGVVSAALGAAAVRPAPTALVVGDLSFLHDLGALQIAARHRLSLLAIVVNNDGGGIFHFLPQAALGATFEALFATPHGLRCEGAVTMCGGRHVAAADAPALGAAIDGWLAEGGLVVAEVPSDRAATRALHDRVRAAVAAALAALAPADDDARPTAVSP